MDTFQPPTFAPLIPSTNYNMAVLKAGFMVLMSLLSPIGHVNSCLLLVSDGGTLPLSNNFAAFFKTVKNIAKQNPWNRCICVKCFYVGNGLPHPLFVQSCNLIEAEMPIYVGNPWFVGMSLVSESLAKVFNEKNCSC